MVGAGQGFGVPREIEDPPTIWISFSYGERGARTLIIWKGKDPPSTTGAPLAYLRSTAEEGVEVDFPEIAQSDGTARTHMKDTDGMKGGVLARLFDGQFSKMYIGEMKRTHIKDIDIIDDGTFSWDNVIISKMDGPEMKRTYIKDIGIIDDGTFSRELKDIFSKMDVREKKSAYLRTNGMLLTNALTPSTNSTGDCYLYLDSGASRHMVFDPALLINLRDPPSGTGKFRAADGSLLSVAAYGDIIMENFRIPDVYLVPELTVNLISVGQLASNHKVSSCFAGNACNLMLSGGERIGGAIRRDDNQYILMFLEIE